MGDARVLSLEASAALSSGSVHVHPVGEPTAELFVSNGLTPGAGTIHRANSYAPSSRALKKEIAYLGSEALARALEDVKALRHVRFRYKNESRLRRGLIFEEAPEAIRDANGGLIVNERLASVELAVQAVHKRLSELESAVSERERRGR